MRREALVLSLLVIVVAAGVWGIYELTIPAREFRGILLDPPVQAPDFTLLNRDGEPVSLSDFHGKVIVLSFLYSHCDDECHIIVAKFAEAAKEFQGTRSEAVVFVAVTVDPERDTPERLREYSRIFAYNGYYLTGAREALEEVWADYGILTQREELEEDEYYLVPTEGSLSTYGVLHPLKILLIDEQGKVRSTFLGVEFWLVEDLINDIDLLLSE
ncbi:MAG: SCO family protein [Candidatus Geothermarchaeales archaeon]